MVPPPPEPDRWALGIVEVAADNVVVSSRHLLHKHLLGDSTALRPPPGEAAAAAAASPALCHLVGGSWAGGLAPPEINPDG